MHFVQPFGDLRRGRRSGRFGSERRTEPTVKGWLCLHVAQPYRSASEQRSLGSAEEAESFSQIPSDNDPCHVACCHGRLPARNTSIQKDMIWAIGEKIPFEVTEQ